MILTLAKRKGIHTAIETCGFAPSENFKSIAHIADCFLFDYKDSNSERHRLFTGRDMELIIKNFTLLDKIGAKIILGITLIPAYNDTEENVDGIRKIAQKNH